MFDKYSLGLTKSKEGVNGVLSRVGIGPLDFWEPGFSLLWGILPGSGNCHARRRSRHVCRHV